MRGPENRIISLKYRCMDAEKQFEGQRPHTGFGGALNVQASIRSRL